jgi:hypothetical protein
MIDSKRPDAAAKVGRKPRNTVLRSVRGCFKFSEACRMQYKRRKIDH